MRHPKRLALLLSGFRVVGLKLAHHLRLVEFSAHVQHGIGKPAGDLGAGGSIPGGATLYFDIVLDSFIED